MKKNSYKLTLTAFSLLSFLFSGAQTFEIRTIEDDIGYLTVQMRETSGTGTPTTATNIVDITFVVRYPSGAVDIDLLCSSNDYNMIDGLGGVEQTFGGYDYHYWNASNTPFNPPSNWTQNVWEDIAVFYASGATGSGLFEIAPNNWDGRSLNWRQEVTDYTPTINGDVTYSYPTVVYDYVWTGASNTQWDNGANWLSECGSAIAVAPNTGNNCIIPSGLSNYPNEVNLAQFGGHQPTCSNLKIISGASLTLDEKDVTTLDLIWTFENVIVDGVLTSIPKTRLTVTGSTTINSATGIIIQSDATGTGSFIDNGTITYGGSGSAKVQTYLANTATAPNFHFHLVGPTVDITGTGVQLSAFNVANGNTYAYRYNEPTDAWLNYYNLTDPVPTAKGIGLSTNDGTPYTMEMTGNLKTGNISSEAMSFGLNGNYLLSNPYPSSVFWNDLYSNNSAIVNDKVYIYDATFSGGNYRAYNQGSGGTDDFTGYIQVGQGFFVEATSASPFTFDNGDRHHSTAPFFKSGTFTNRLDVRVTGNDSRDGLLVHFYEGALSGYGSNEDVEKKMSYSSTATQFWTALENNQKMSINALPVALLGEGMQSVPLSFICSATAEYTMSFFDIESFDIGTEIWLEDKQIGGDWISINDQSVYTFAGSPDDAADRFVLHFFSPTGTDELAKPTVDIYSFGQHAYVRNNTAETIREVRVYSLSGSLVRNLKTTDQKFMKIWVDNQMAYYVIRVVTDQQVYTEKIFINK